MQFHVVGEITSQIALSFGTRGLPPRGGSDAVHAGTIDGAALCRMFNRAIRGQRWMPKFLSSDNDPLYRFHQWQANLK
jgi:hypothetical protein